jgi:excisionase family DNA binding protein
MTNEEHDLPVLIVDDAADRLRVSPSSIRRLVAAGVLPHHRVGGLLRFTAGDLQEFARRSSVPPAL